jgi:hypothetical protein
MAYSQTKEPLVFVLGRVVLIFENGYEDALSE